MSQKFAWLPVKDADLATLKRELCVAPEYEDKAVAKFQKFCTDNDFDQYGLAAHPNPLTLKSVLAGSISRSCSPRLVRSGSSPWRRRSLASSWTMRPVCSKTPRLAAGAMLPSPTCLCAVITAVMPRLNGRLG